MLIKIYVQCICKVISNKKKCKTKILKKIFDKNVGNKQQKIVKILENKIR